MIIKCDRCGIEFNKLPSQIKISKKHFCSKKCHYDSYKNILTGKIFGELEVLEFDCVDKYGHNKFKCKCSCGKIISIRSNILKKQNSCKNCCSRQYVGKISGHYFSGIKKGAKNRKGGIEFDITKEQLWDLYQKQNGKCAYSGLDVDFGDTTYEHQHGITTASLDRINSDIGYVKENVQWVHKDINHIKWDLSENLFFYYIKNIIEFDKIFTKIKNYQLSEKHGLFKGFGEISRAYWGKVQYDAKGRDISFNLKIEDVWGKYLNQGGLCYYSGLPIQFYPKTKTKEHWKKQTASIDRIDSSKPYEIDNIVITHKDINKMKLDFVKEEFLFYCNKIYKHSNLKERTFND